MNDQFLPELFERADQIAIRFQDRYLFLTRLSLALLVLGAACVAASVTFRDIRPWLALIAAVLLTISLAVRVVGRLNRLNQVWRDSRTVAENVKTIVWRYTCRAEPYSEEEEPSKVDARLLDDLHGLLEEYGGLSPLLFVPGRDEVAITEPMRSLREAALAERRQTFLEQRLQDQADWFERKVIANNLSENRSAAMIIAAQIAAVITALVVFLYPKLPILLTGVMTSLAASWAAWQRIHLPAGQSRIYADTARHLNRATRKVKETSSEAEFSALVRDIEETLVQEVKIWRMRRTNIQ